MPTIDIGYKPREQFLAYHARKQRYSVIVAHRRCGKTVATIVDLIDHALRCTKKRPQYGYLSPTYKQSKRVAYDYLVEYTRQIPGVEHKVSELSITLPNGAKIQLFGADNAEGLRGIYLDGCAIDEPADIAPSVYPTVIRPALADRNGWASWIGTPKGHNQFYDLWTESQDHPEEFYSLMLRASETGILPQAELDAARRQMSEEQYEQEFECSFEAALLGAYYGKLMAQATKEDRITRVPYEPGVPVYTAWDLGLDDATAVWWAQVVGREVRLIRYQEWTNTALTDIAREVLAHPYVYKDHYLPHDAQIRELTTARTRKETLESLGLRPVIVTPNHNVPDGIEAARQLIPRAVFDNQGCKDGVEALKQYQREFDEKLQTFKNRPRHDWASHGADAFRYLAMNLNTARNAQYQRRKPRRLVIA